MKEPNKTQWQDDLREWYHLKSREYTSANYPKVLDRAKRRNEIEERLDKLETRRQLEHNQLFAKFEDLRIKAPRKIELLKDGSNGQTLQFSEGEKRSSLTDSKLEFKPTSPIQPEQFLHSTARPLITVSKNEPIPSQEIQNLAPTQPKSLFGPNIQQPNIISSITPAQIQPKPQEPVKNSGFFFNPSLPAISAPIFPTTSTAPQETSKLQEKPPSFNFLTPKVESSNHDVLKRKSPLVALPKLSSESKLQKWLNFYLDFYSKFNRTVEIFEHDVSQKDLRILLKRSISEKIDVLTKRKANNNDIANVVVFIDDLLRNQPVLGIEKEQIQISPGNQPALRYAAATICDKYLTLIKWDLELLDVITMVISTMFFKSKEFRLTFISKIVHSMVLLHFNLDKIAEKINSIMEKSPEMLANWLPSESATFLLFCRLQIVLTSSKVPINNEALSDIGGIQLVIMIFEEALKLDTPILLSSAFILTKILKNCSSHFLKHHKELLQKHMNNLEKLNTVDFGSQISEVSKKLKNGGENFLKTSTGMLKVQFGETLKKIREQIEKS
uniref:Nucleoporin GLE1 n=1 Tax=Acrobeloides nanus TaxID=290746 RepID=A0A914CX49_9BILA